MCQENSESEQKPQLVMIEKKKHDGPCQGRCRQEGEDVEAQRAKCHGPKEENQPK